MLGFYRDRAIRRRAQHRAHDWQERGSVERMKVPTQPRVTVFAIDPHGDVRSA